MVQSSDVLENKRSAPANDKCLGMYAYGETISTILRVRQHRDSALGISVCLASHLSIRSD